MFENFSGLDSMFSEDPKKQAQWAMIMGLLGNQGGRGGRGFMQGLGQAGLLGMNQFERGRQGQQRALSQKQEAELRAMQMDQMKRQQADQDYAAKIAPQFFSPGVTPSTPNDDQGYPMPSAAPKADLSGYGMALAGRNPAMGMPYIQAGMKDTTPISVKPGESLVDRNTFQPKFTAPDKPHWIDAGDKMIPVGPDGKQVGAAIPKNMSPDAQDSSRRGWAGLRQSERQFQQNYGKPQIVEGNDGYNAVSFGRGSPQVTPIPQLGKGTKKQPSESELVAAGFASRMVASDKLLSGMPTSAVPNLAQSIMNQRTPALAPYASGEGPQQYRQAQEDWVRAKLRKESGAAIPDEEMAREIRVYFPQPGEGEKVINQKAIARQRANDAMMMAAGKARGLIQSEPSQGFRYLGPE